VILAYAFTIYARYDTDIEYGNSEIDKSLFKITVDDMTTLINKNGNVGAKITSFDSDTHFIEFYIDNLAISDCIIYDRYNEDVTNTLLSFGITKTVTNNKIKIEGTGEQFSNFCDEIGGGLYPYIKVKVVQGTPKVNYTITENINGVSSDNRDESLEENLCKTITYTVNEDDTIITGYNSNIGTLVLSTDKKSLIWTFTATENAIINVSASKEFHIRITGTIKNASCNYSDGDLINPLKRFEITANDGYSFKNIYNYKENYLTSSMEKTNDNTKLYVDLKDGCNYTFNDNYIATREVKQITSFCNLYKVTNKDLSELAKSRFANDFDYGTYITSLYQIPFPIDDTLVSEDISNIILGNYDTGVSVSRFNDYKAEIDGGTITVAEKYQNVYDYLNTECILHLPYFNKMFLNTEYVINQTLTIKYIIDLYTGNVTCNIYSSFINDIIESQTQQIAINIPFIQKQNNNIIGTLSNINKNIIDTAFIEIVRNIPYDTVNIFGKETIDYGVIGDYHGFIKCQNVMLETSATNEEKEEIASLLKGGIFI
jgi:hypothetical protein